MDHHTMKKTGSFQKTEFVTENPQTDPKRLTVIMVFIEPKIGMEIDLGKFYILASSELIKLMRPKIITMLILCILIVGMAGALLSFGDSHDNTWEHILDNWEDDVKDVDLAYSPSSWAEIWSVVRFLTQ